MLGINHDNNGDDSSSKQLIIPMMFQKLIRKYLKDENEEIVPIIKIIFESIVEISQRKDL